MKNFWRIADQVVPIWEIFSGTTSSFPKRERAGEYGMDKPGRLLTGILLFILLLFPQVPAACAGEVVLSTPQAEYYVIAGDEAVIPLTIGSTYDHDITGMIETAKIPVNPASAGSSGATRQLQEFSAFTETRTVSLPVGRSDIPSDYLLTVSFRYSDDGERTATLPGIIIHVITSTDEKPVTQGKETLLSTDTGNSGSVASGDRLVSGKEIREPQGPAEELQNSQMQQDTSALRSQLAGEANVSGDREAELWGYIMADPVMVSLNSSLAKAGLRAEDRDCTPESNTSGRFTIMYANGSAGARITGAIADTRIRYAEESSDSLVPLPDPLLDNTTYREYESLVTEAGFLRNRTWINVTPDRETVDIAYAGPGNRILHLRAELVNGTVVAIKGESPDDPLLALAPFLALCTVILLSAGIWYLARIRPKDLPAPDEPVSVPEPGEDPGLAAGHLLDEADCDASLGKWPEAYRKTGRAIRILISREICNGDEVTSGELEEILRFSGDSSGKIREVLDRCRCVGFAKGSPDPDELGGMIRFARTLLPKESTAEWEEIRKTR